MTLDHDGCTDNESLKVWFKSIFENQSIQNELIACETKSEFIERAMELAQLNGYIFPIEALNETFCEFERFDTPDEEDLWIRKLLEMGWTPLGYSR